MVAEPARDQIPEWDGQANTLERFEEDVLLFTHAVPKDRKVTLGPKLLQQFPKGSPQREIGLKLLKSGVGSQDDIVARISVEHRHVRQESARGCRMH